MLGRKSPDRPNAVGEGLAAVVLAAIDEGLEPRAEPSVLRGRPVVDTSEPEWSGCKRAILSTRTGTGRWCGRIAGVVTHRVEFIL